MRSNSRLQLGAQSKADTWGGRRGGGEYVVRGAAQEVLHSSVQRFANPMLPGMGFPAECDHVEPESVARHACQLCRMLIMNGGVLRALAMRNCPGWNRP